jgi:hypothetical protein
METSSPLLTKTTGPWTPFIGGKMKLIITMIPGKVYSIQHYVIITLLPFFIEMLQYDWL